MLQNAYFLAKIGADTAENEQHFAKNLPKIANYPTGPSGASPAEPPLAARPSRAGGTRSRLLSELRERPWRVRARPLQSPSPGSRPARSGKLYRARSRLYRNEILQENMRLTAFFKLYKICILLRRCNLKIFAKNRFEKTAIFVKIQQ